jgi:hypothetical protein
VDPGFHFNADPDLLLIKVMRICDNWSTDSSGLHFEPPRLHCERLRPQRLHLELLKLLNFAFNAEPDPDPPFRSKKDPISKNDPGPQPFPREKKPPQTGPKNTKNHNKTEFMKY